jgi:hypothetical protein
MAKWIDHHKILPLRKNKQKYNANSNAVLKVLAGKWMEKITSPKTPNFAGNLMGDVKHATIDVWAARFVHELGHKDATKPWLIQPGAETGVTPLDFAFAQRAFGVAASHIKDMNGNPIEPHDLQAIAWYFQKHIWDARGYTKGQGAEKASFDETFDAIFSPDGKRFDEETITKHLAAAKAKRLAAAAAKGEERVEAPPED